MRTTVPCAAGASSRQPNGKWKRKNKLGQRTSRRDKLRIERLEDRLLLTAAPVGDDNLFLLSGHGGVCNCPVCTGALLDEIPPAEVDTSGGAQAPLTSLPLLHSNVGATAKLFLDFDGHFEAAWSFYSNVTTPVFSQDADLTTFSADELTAIYEIWARVAEDFAPFNIDVTTVDPGTPANGVVAVIAIGGSAADWYGSSAGGVAFIGGFYNPSSNVGYVFENNLSSNSKYIAEASSHEAGHLFGLSHQATWSGSTLITEYSTGSGSWAPIMGSGYNAPRTTWHNGTTSSGPSNFQDNLAVLSGATNGFGYKTDDYGGTTGTAGNLPTIGTSVNFSGLIGQANDVDVWSFTTTGGSVTFQLTGAQYGSNLDAVLELWNSSGSTILSDSPSGSQGASLTTSLGAGTYYLVARSLGDYGDMGQYTITGSLPAAGPSPEIDLTISGVSVADGGSVSFGNTGVGTSVTQTVTVTNQGSSVLSLTALNGGSLPAGFTLVSNLGATSLNAGESTTFVIRLDATASGSFSGAIQLINDDGNENPYDLVLSGTVTAPEIAISISGTGVADGQTVNFGSTTQGTSVSRIFTVTNTGTSTLTLTALNAGSLPAGFTLVANVGSTSLAAGQSTTFTIRLDAAAAGSFGGTIQLVNNDGDENPYDLVLSGAVTAPEIEIAISGSGVADGQTVNFGATDVGQSVSRVFTVTNTGTATLTLTPLNSANLPAGFTLVSNLGSTSLSAGQSTTFTIRLDASAAGSFGGAIQLASNDSDESPYDLVLTGSVAAPEITVDVAGVDLSDGQTVNFGATTVGQVVNRTFTVTNVGNATLTLTPINPASLPSGFTLVSNLGSTSLAAGQSTTFSVRFDAAAVGSFSGTLQLSSNDSNESPFDLTLSGVVQAPEIKITLNGANVADGQLIDFGSTVTGVTVSRTFTVINEGTSALDLAALTPGIMPTGFSLVSNLGATTLAAGQSTTFVIRFDASVVGTFGGSISLVNTDSDENPFDLQFQAVATVPAPAEFTVLVNGQVLVSGGVFDFGTTVTGTTLERRIWIRNDGGTTLTLGALDPNGLPTGFSVLQDLTNMSLAPGETASFVLRLDAQAAGSFGGQLSLASNDSDGPFTIEVLGTVVDPMAPVLRVLDNGDAGSAAVGAWSKATGKGYLKDIHTAAKGQGAKTYTWSFGDLPAGEYRVWATWTTGSTNATNAPYSLLDGGNLQSKVSVNQKTAPSGLTVNGTRYRLLGTVTVASGQLNVRLSNAANGQVVADAIRIERVITVFAPTAEISVSANGSELSPGTSMVDFGAPELGNHQTRTFTVFNYGTASLTLNLIDPASLPAGFTLVENLGSTFLTPGESTTFTVRLNADTAGSFAGSICVENSDQNEYHSTFQVVGTVYDPNAPVVRTIDDGSTGNVRVGSWARVTGKGYSSDQWTGKAGNGSIHSTWNFTNLSNGQYRVYATWRQDPSLATNAPYTLYNGNQLVSTVRLNQRVAPNDVWDGGWFESLGTVTVTGNQLLVKLTNSANGTVVADAIRIEKILPAGAALLTSPWVDSSAVESAPNTWMTSFLASQQTAPPAIPTPDHSPAAPSQSADALAAALSTSPALGSDGGELEDQLLAGVLDLLAAARHAGFGPADGELSVHELALASVLG